MGGPELFKEIGGGPLARCAWHSRQLVVGVSCGTTIVVVEVVAVLALRVGVGVGVGIKLGVGVGVGITP